MNRGFSRLFHDDAVDYANRSWIGWLLLGVLCAALLAPVFKLAFPTAAAGWRIDRAEAIDIALEQLRSLGEPPADAYVTAVLRSDELLEAELLRRWASRREAFEESRLRQALRRWEVSVYDRRARSRDWSYRAEISIDGQLLALVRGSATADPPAELLTRREARRRAADFLSERGYDLADFDAPLERQLGSGFDSDLYLRYRQRESLLGPEVLCGLEVHFVGSRLDGFYSWVEGVRELSGAAERDVQLLGTVWALSLFVLLPLALVVFVRRYHDGVVSVSRASQLFLLTFGTMVAAATLSASSLAEDLSLGSLTRWQTTFVLLAGLTVTYLPALAGVVFCSWAVGESLPAWRPKLRAMDAVLRGAWTNSTVASSSIRGVALGCALTLVLGLLVTALRQLGVVVPFSLLLGPGWPSARWPGVALLLLFFAVVLFCESYRLLFVLPLASRLGRWPAIVLATLLGAVLTTTLMRALPVLWGLLLAIGVAAVSVILFLCYDFLTALLATGLAALVLRALPLVMAEDLTLQLQGWLAVLGFTAPLWSSLRWLGSPHTYRFVDDAVPRHVKRITDRERQRVELETARRIQSSILPTLPGHLAGVEIAYRYRPATEVGGDFYDVLPVGNNRLALAIGDVAGHGVSSGLVMAMLRAALSVQVGFRPEVEEVVPALNRIVRQSGDRRHLATLWYGLLDLEARRISFASAGHLFPYRVRAAEIVCLESVSYPLGARQEIELESREMEVLPGDLLFLASDGLVEARRAGSEELYGFERLEESLLRHAGEPPQALRDGVLADLERFLRLGQEPVEWYDDLTILVVGVEEEQRSQLPAG